ncbi:peptidylprolyl isomerase [Deinococcus hopiensis]|uniref:Peptidyl-prolyl cis-trans isomerase n=1 Tax=Deinococcus hopiensis KR-140 TaxID=695939 RepID=A0A1W1VS03_9DEIO|nr:peptidylprolyl isomerase [Deinococcus hopiensis]SMB96162.1 peptidylprolyl isomerase [Deinococcus hopiensis KR-140]
MKQAASIHAVLLAALLASAAAQTTQAQTTKAGATKAPAGAASTKPGPLPAGYTLVPPLSSKPVRTFKAAPALALQGRQDYYALFDTGKGQILIDLYEQETPVTVNNFVYLARNHFYDGTRFHRVIEGFMAQGGDPGSTDPSKKATWGTGGPGYSFADEFRTRLKFTGSGVLAMANSGPATNGSQFFITFAPTDFLNGKHTIFGKVVKGDDVLKKLTRTMDQSNADIAGAVADQVISVRILTKKR